MHNGDLIIELQDDDLRAQVDQASAAVAAARAAIENNRRQGELQDSRIARALAGIDEATAQIVAAEAGKEAVRAQLVPAHSERRRQQALKQTRSTTQQTPEAAVANDDPPLAQLASREAEPRSKSVLESQDMELRADLLAKQAALAAAKVHLDYTKIYAPGDGNVGERQVQSGQLARRLFMRWAAHQNDPLALHNPCGA